MQRNTTTNTPHEMLENSREMLRKSYNQIKASFFNFDLPMWLLNGQPPLGSNSVLEIVSTLITVLTNKISRLEGSDVTNEEREFYGFSNEMLSAMKELRSILNKLQRGLEQKIIFDVAAIHILSAITDHYHKTETNAADYAVKLRQKKQAYDFDTYNKKKYRPLDEISLDEKTIATLVAVYCNSNDNLEVECLIYTLIQGKNLQPFRDQLAATDNTAYLSKLDKWISETMQIPCNDENETSQDNNNAQNKQTPSQAEKKVRIASTKKPAAAETTSKELVASFGLGAIIGGAIGGALGLVFFGVGAVPLAMLGAAIGMGVFGGMLNVFGPGHSASKFKNDKQETTDIPANEKNKEKNDVDQTLYQVLGQSLTNPVANSQNAKTNASAYKKLFVAPTLDALRNNNPGDPNCMDSIGFKH